MNYRGIIRLPLMAGAIALLLSGCSASSREGRAPIDPPPVGAEEMMNGSAAQPAGANAAADPKQEAEGVETTLYVKDADGFVVPVSLPLPQTAAAEKTALEYLVEDGPVQSLLPEDFTALLPKGTEVRDVAIGEDKVAVVDFSAAFTDYNPADERKILEAVTWTLTGFPSVESVKLLVEGQELPEMPQAATPLDAPLSRKVGINLEIGKGVNAGWSTPVTLYFRSQTEGHFAYHVPVTRLVDRTDDPAKAAVAELLKGPDPDKGLLTAVSTDAGALSVTRAEDGSLVSVDFDSKFLDADKVASPEALEAVILTLSDTTGIPSVEISVNGSSEIAVSGDQSYTMPAVRPETVNPYKS